MESGLIISSWGGLSGINNIGDFGIEDNPINMFFPSLSKMQNLSFSDGKGRASIALDLSSERILSQPKSVKCKYAPRLPAVKSLETSPSFLSLLNSAEA